MPQKNQKLNSILLFSWKDSQKTFFFLQIWLSFFLTKDSKDSICFSFRLYINHVFYGHQKSWFVFLLWAHGLREFILPWKLFRKIRVDLRNCDFFREIWQKNEIIHDHFHTESMELKYTYYFWPCHYMV